MTSPVAGETARMSLDSAFSDAIDRAAFSCPSPSTSSAGKLSAGPWPETLADPTRSPAREFMAMTVAHSVSGAAAVGPVTQASRWTWTLCAVQSEPNGARTEGTADGRRCRAD